MAPVMVGGECRAGQHGDAVLCMALHAIARVQILHVSKCIGTYEQFVEAGVIPWLGVS